MDFLSHYLRPRIIDVFRLGVVGWVVGSWHDRQQNDLVARVAFWILCGALNSCMLAVGVLKRLRRERPRAQEKQTLTSSSFMGCFRLEVYLLFRRACMKY